VQPLVAADILHSTFEASSQVDNPWAGASGAMSSPGGALAVRPGAQPAVNNSGQVVNGTQFSPSVAVGDLNGDGLPDLVIGDARGFFWFFPNTGTAGAPKFTQGEIMPVWIGATQNDPDYNDLAGGGDNCVPHIQLISLAGTKLLDIVAGNYNGRLFYIHNTGSTSNPVFKVTPSRLHDMQVKTRKDGLLWCNFIAPFLYDWWNTGSLDLIMGDGSYSANSIFLFKNKGNRDNPTFTEENMTKIIPGMGREHLTPQVVDWNGDGKPDIIAGERTGHINVFLNTSADATQAVPTFDAGTYLKVGTKDTFGEMVNVTVCDLTGNKLPNLIISNNHGDISYATNIGKPGAPLFSDPVPIAGVNPYPKILRPIGWSLRSPFGVPNELLVCTNATVQPDFTPPPNTPWKNALRYYVYPIKNTYFPDFYYPISDQIFDDTHWIKCGTEFSVKEDTDYKLTCWIKTSGNLTNLKAHFWGYRTEPGEEDEHFDAACDVGTYSSWNEFSGNLRFSFRDKKKPDARFEAGTAALWFTWNGQGEIYLDDVKVAAP
jgi:hypothetical protein